jgi:hypothetical protein
VPTRSGADKNQSVSAGIDRLAGKRRRGDVGEDETAIAMHGIKRARR